MSWIHLDLQSTHNKDPYLRATGLRLRDFDHSFVVIQAMANLEETSAARHVQNLQKRDAHIDTASRAARTLGPGYGAAIAAYESLADAAG